MSSNPTTTRVVVAAMLFVVTGCGDQLPLPSEPAQRIAAGPAPSATVYPADMWAQVVEGEVGPGTQYRLYVPPSRDTRFGPKWNGKLVVYAHGIVAPYYPAALPLEGDGMAEIFRSQGFAVAMSSYKETGLAMKDGTQRTHQVAGIFASKFGKPARTYLVGSSMGGYIVARLAEKYPNQYDGVMPMCGVVGGFPAEFAYVLHTRVMFDALYHNPVSGKPLLPGSAMAVPPLHSDAEAQAYGAYAGSLLTGAGPLIIALADQTRMPVEGVLAGEITFPQLGEFVVTPLVLHAVFINDIVQHTHGHFPITNVGTTYGTTSAYAWLLPGPASFFYAPVNAAAVSVAADRDALNWVEQNGNTSGRISIPTLTLHTKYDTWVPIEQERIYYEKVKAADKLDLLVQRTTNSGFGHCKFTTPEIATGLAQLVDWAENGSEHKPAP